MKPIEFEKLYGTEAFLKCCILTINAILTDKDICSEEQLKNKFDFFSSMFITENIS
jgi:hypothetical protein